MMTSSVTYSVDYISDIHIDHHVSDTTIYNKVKTFLLQNAFPKDFVFGIKRPLLILAGDIFDMHHAAPNVFKVFKEYYEDVVYVYGNHECYVYSKSMVSTEEKLDTIREAAKAMGVHMLEGNTIDINGITIGGSSAWYDFSYGYGFNNTYEMMYKKWREYMSDAKLVADYMMSSEGYSSNRFASLDFPAFLDKRMKEVNSIPEDTDIVVTHISPIVPKELPEYYKNDSTGFYFFDGTKEVERIKPKLWIFGHTHDEYEYTHGDTTLVCNPFGYRSERGKKVGLSTRIKTFILHKNKETQNVINEQETVQEP